MSATDPESQVDQRAPGSNWTQILGLLFALCVGIVIGSLDEFRDRMPWRQHEVAIDQPQVVYVTPPPTAATTPAPPGAWMRDKARSTSLDRPSYNRSTGPGAAILYPPGATPYGYR